MIASILLFQEIYKIGGRKFGLSKLTALGCDPALRALKLATTGGSGCMDEATMLAKLHNIALPEVLKELESHLKGFTYSIFDFYTTADERLNNPSKYGKELPIFSYPGLLGLFYSNFTFFSLIFPFNLCEGFKEVKMACCGSGPYRGSFTCGLKGYQLCDNVSEYLYFDAVHPTEKANYQFAKLMWKGSTQVVKPYNLKTLFEI
jgi:phospholipase/lecithinase/hemolysin